MGTVKRYSTRAGESCAHSHPPDVPTTPCPEGQGGPSAIVVERLAVFSAGETWEGVGEASHEIAATEAAATVKVDPVMCQPFMTFVKDSARFNACMAVSRRIGALKGADKMHQLIAPHIERLDQEEFHLLVLDVHAYLRYWARIHQGQRAGVEVSNGDVQRYAIGLGLLMGAGGAGGIAVVHNHPSGDPTPSKKDDELTAHLYAACSINQMGLVDHMIIGSEGRYYSYLKAGKLPH